MTVEMSKLPSQGAHVTIHIQVTAEMNVSAYAARKKVMGFVVDEISTQLRAGEPVMVVGEQIIWRVPLYLTLRSIENAGEVGAIDVDVETGHLLVDQMLIEQIQDRSHYVATRSSHRTA